ncbi:MAG: hypothetical protein U0930_05665 [Pirellulales bacterium]
MLQVVGDFSCNSKQSLLVTSVVMPGKLRKRWKNPTFVNAEILDQFDNGSFSLFCRTIAAMNPINHDYITSSLVASRPMIGNSFTVDVRVNDYGQLTKGYQFGLKRTGQCCFRKLSTS